MTPDNENDPHGAKACDFLISMYDGLIEATYGNPPALRKIYEMALESETLDRWPAEQRLRLIRMFEDAIKLAEDEGVAGRTVH